MTLTSQKIAVFCYRIFIVMCFILLQGCISGGPYAPVADRNQRPKVTSGFHIVKPGETLYSIAAHYGWDYRALANANNILPPYTIYPRQRILFEQSKIKSVVKKKEPKVIKQTTVVNKTKSEPVKKTTGKLNTKKVSSVANLRWQWPVSGKVVSQFTTKGKVNKGIDIEAKLGQPVSSAAEGKVIYAGSSPLGYGKLIIIEHNSKYLSTYGHIKSLAVKEGDRVKMGQKIAELGSNGSAKAILHFEIRHKNKGKPVNPLKYLPK
ncbi:peptidoglycan DD-metalloendopeptidase family protein [Zooshikella ganghwensis]|uniref:peptidoglycan DD-metalloendopeptidase family protein n=1 Tax=Zooshikella ganghwensis TaxID=202772 RepID=UPI00040220F0|nr:peptidoglycan DD-metalloendopeptidase family protein [Zooshikella ganghwensis]